VAHRKNSTIHWRPDVARGKKEKAEKACGSLGSIKENANMVAERNIGRALRV